MSTASPHATLQDELGLIAALQEILQQEQQLLVSADTAGLDELTPRKSQAVLQMAALAERRHQSLGAAGFGADESGMEAWLLSVGDAGMQSVWQQLLGKTREAKEQNRVNGMLINKQMSQTQSLINAMRTPSSAGEAAVYGRSGQAAPGGPSKRYVVG